MLGTLPKASTDDLDYTIDWSLWLKADTISSSTWTLPPDLTQTGASNDATTATLKVKGGTSGKSYTIQNTIVTVTSNETKSETFKLRIT